MLTAVASATPVAVAKLAANAKPPISPAPVSASAAIEAMIATVFRALAVIASCIERVPGDPGERRPAVTYYGVMPLSRAKLSG